MSYLNKETVSIHYNYLQSKNPHAETIILAHGLGLNMKTWKYLIKEFQDYHLLLFDFRGHGETKGDCHALTWDILYGDFTALLKQLNIDHYHFIGHGLGAYFGIQLFGEYGEKAESLTLIGITSFFPNEISEEMLAYRKRFSKPENYPALADFMIPQIIHKMTPEKHQLLYEAYHQVEQKVYFQLIELIARSSSLSKLRSIPIPTLVLGGECDPNYLPTFVTMNSHYLPNGRTAIIIDASNMVHIDQPEIVARIFRHFLKTKYDDLKPNSHYSDVLDHYFDRLSLSRSKASHSLDQKIVIRLLHNFEMINKGKKVSGHWNRRSAKELLAFLAINRVVLREQLFEVFWPHLPLPNAQNQLRVALSHLRKIFADAGFPNAITTNKKDLQLNIDYECDVLQLQELIKKASTLTDYPLLHRSILQILEKLDQDLELFPDFYFDWFLDFKLYLEEQIIYLFTRSYPLFIEHEDYILAKQMLEIILKFKPFNQSIKQDFYLVNEKLNQA
ncbi:pimeloyl-ACP methyl ester carboxylesterase/DNA-binding SARP family transcriptional activator [Pullulanibacillus pueri]|nr:alpha/beta hydrolase [Pullulanibacillus pueri]MBM7682862.1 pimeloyl-ACP methyl ester carboxylesterase/DNA-binding SARP family transcriptional activator [Pullulanibacillus pueri]